MVTGAYSGIGRATAIHLAERGHRVIGTVRSIDKATKLNAMAAERGVSVELAELDVNIVHFTSSVESGAWSGEPLFVADLDTCAPAGFDLEELRARLDRMEERMTLEIDIE